MTACWPGPATAPTRARTSRRPPSSASRVLTLELVDPRFHHLDTCLAALDDSNVAYDPQAFSAAGQDLLEALYPDAVVASRADAEVLG